MTRRPVYILSVFLIMHFTQALAQYQKPGNTWLLQELLKAPTGNNYIYCIFIANEPLLFWPNDLPLDEPKAPSGEESIIRIKDKLFYPLFGTGRVYEIKETNGRINFTRIDSTVFFGFNFGAFNFNYRDTLYSLGGYGMWHFNGHLRYFHPIGKDWEIKPINFLLPAATLDKKGSFYDFQNSNITVLGQPHIDHGLKRHYINKPNQEADTLNFFQLNLITKEWKKLGKPTSSSKHLIQSGIKIGIHPQGELITMANRNQPRIYLLNYQKNRIEYLKDLQNSALLQKLFHLGHIQNPSSRIITYFNSNDSTLNVLTSKKEHYTFKMGGQDFMKTPDSIYESNSFTLLAAIKNPLHLSLLINLLVIFGSLIFFYRLKSAASQNLNIENKQVYEFNDIEKNIILKLVESSGNMISLNQIDLLLGTKGKSLDAQNKRRSSIIKTINFKYESNTEDTEPLIFNTRLKEDRRMIRYKIDLNKYNKIRHLVEQNPPLKKQEEALS